MTLPPSVRAALDGTQTLFRLHPVWRRLINVVLHAGMVTISSAAAFWLRFDGPAPPEQDGLWVRYLPALLLIRGLTFVPLRLYEGLWRYTSIWDLRRIVTGVTASSLAFFVLMHGVLRVLEYPRSIFIIDAILLILLMGGLRLGRRILREVATTQGDRRLLIFGAGDAGEMIARDIKTHARGDYEPIGFIDDDAGKTGKRIHGLPVLGTRADIQEVIATHRPDEVLVALPHADPAVLRGVVRALEPFKIPISTLPSLRELLGGTVGAAQIRKLEVADLLPRGPVGLDARPLRRFIEGRPVMVTGAGGSIGSELCRQILSYQPSALILFERYENGLYAIATELQDHPLAGRVNSVIGDITDQPAVDAALLRFRPAIVFHAAAHKHVPLMEGSPAEAVKNNVRGTRILVEAAERHHVERFILISSDKAVNPSSVMGATKRVAELLLQARAGTSNTVFTTVRFGNVLGSNGSVVPRFLDQIKAGGPVTITHPEIRRYFMLIPEAVQLVLHAAAEGRAGATYVLEMGEQIRILDLARDLIRLSGLSPDEIAIRTVGLRPGEKLFEELVARDEAVEASETQGVLRVRAAKVPQRASVDRQIDELERCALAPGGDVIAGIRRVVPEFNPGSMPLPAEQPIEIVMVASAERGHQACPSCGSFNFHRSKARTTIERALNRFRSDRLHRCHQCGWRGRVPTLDWAAESSLEKTLDKALNLDALDKITRQPGPPGESFGA